MENLAITIIVLMFYAALAFALSSKVKSKNHQSRNTIKSFIFVLSAILGATLVTSMIVWLVISSANLSRGNIATAFGVGAIMLSAIRAWRWSFSKIEVAVDGYKFEEPAAINPLHMISKEQYFNKYRTNEKKLMAAVSMGKIQSSIESGELLIEDKKC